MLLLFTLPGLPMLYHGVETGLAGNNPHESRRVMPWTEEARDLELLHYVRALARMRLESRALRTGSFAPLFADNRSRTLVFERRFGAERAIVGLNDGYRSCRVRAGGLDRMVRPGETFLRIERRGQKPVETAWRSASAKRRASRE